MARRDGAITEATALLRESGPAALTSVNVAAQLGVTQSAIYRHIRNMDELTTIASNAVIAELGRVMIAAVASPETTWGTGIRALLEMGSILIVGELEQTCRRGYEPALTATERTTVLRQAQAVDDDGHAAARLARSLPDNLDLDAIAAIFKYRILAGWVSFVIDMNRRIGLPVPQIDLDQGIVVD